MLAELVSPVYLPPSESLGALHMLNVLAIDPFERPLPIPSHSLGSTRGQIVPRCEFVREDSTVHTHPGIVLGQSVRKRIHFSVKKSSPELTPHVS